MHDAILTFVAPFPIFSAIHSAALSTWKRDNVRPWKEKVTDVDGTTTTATDTGWRGMRWDEIYDAGRRSERCIVEGGEMKGTKDPQVNNNEGEKGRRRRHRLTPQPQRSPPTLCRSCQQHWKITNRWILRSSLRLNWKWRSLLVQNCVWIICRRSCAWWRRSNSTGDRVGQGRMRQDETESLAGDVLSMFSIYFFHL